jgi:hypothetical protein
MTFTWNVVRGSDGKVEIVEGYASLDEAVAEMANYWDDTSNAWGNFVTDEAGEVVATAIYAGEELLVSCADGRRLSFNRPDDLEGKG